ncbi:hypothetical protein Taro_029295 [Colocasia esculenta]|uniref:Ubiquitin-like domain-containing protein n=1 Tax=Colocasia esculenta TaxID=4460 RepID=A0A843VWT9_COLES|nr:hypothetical protein [Colocasia esculenta]
MKLTVKTLKGNHFEIHVQPGDTGLKHLDTGLKKCSGCSSGMNFILRLRDQKPVWTSVHCLEDLPIGKPCSLPDILLAMQVMAVKKNIEEVQGKESYPWGQQLLIHNGKVLKDESTLEECNVSEDGFLVVMLSKVSKTAGTAGSSSAQLQKQRIRYGIKIPTGAEARVAEEGTYPVKVPFSWEVRETESMV